MSLPWDHPDADPLGDIRRAVQQSATRETYERLRREDPHMQLLEEFLKDYPLTPWQQDYVHRMLYGRPPVKVCHTQRRPRRQGQRVTGMWFDEVDLMPFLATKPSTVHSGFWVDFMTRGLP